MPIPSASPWHFRGRTLDLDGVPRVMGILNVTPDSFSDGGAFLATDAAIAHGLKMAAEGAALIDVGGESTRPGAQPVTPDEECRRILPVIRGLVAAGAPPISVDTRHAVVAEAALAAGAVIVNDVEANRRDDSLWRVVRDAGAGYVAMHMQGQPATMQEAPRYNDVVTEIRDFFHDRIERLGALGIDPACVVIDPGIGFGKTQEHNLELLHRIGDFTGIGRPVLLGVSRKSFLGRITGAAPADRVPGGLACTLWAAMHGVRLFRTHDVGATFQALQVWQAVGRGWQVAA